MKVIINNILPLKGFKCINLFGILFCRRQLNEIDINHETIHTKQGWELLWIGFYIWYLIEYLIRLVIYRDTWMAYKNISFEREAYSNQSNLSYLNRRKHYSWFKCIKNSNYYTV